MIVTGDDGRAVWVYGRELVAPPVLGAVPVDCGRDGTTVTVAVEEATTKRAVVRIWRSRPLLGLGLLPSVPAGPDIAVHMTATSVTAPDTLV
ncbi:MULTISPECIES: hypothetical protein [unclassified Streptomyces]|uniref:hypothetical protein n=1 Tax=unclassified Streptomyces TaxID=2593676 RepID=UPI001160FCD8|nr:hypothetical protein [Streptomyces sp. TSRI0281]